MPSEVGHYTQEVVTSYISLESHHQPLCALCSSHLLLMLSKHMGKFVSMLSKQMGNFDETVRFGLIQNKNRQHLHF